MIVSSTAPEWTISDATVPYSQCIETMRARVAAIRDEGAAELVWLLEHPPLYTAGTSAKPSDLRCPERFPIYQAGRGGEWTYHGPGQQIGYVMLDLSRTHGTVPARDTHAYVTALEAWLITTLCDFGVVGERRPGRVGVWVQNSITGVDEKIGAIGVRVTRWVSWHGVSLNVAPDIEHFSGIVPCGLREFGVTSLAALGLGVKMPEIRAHLRTSWMKIFA